MMSRDLLMGAEVFIRYGSQTSSAANFRLFRFHAEVNFRDALLTRIGAHLYRASDELATC